MQTIFGYVRVSTQEQNEARQLASPAPYDIPKRNIYLDKQSGKDFDRPAYCRILRRLKHGDLLYLKSIDRLGRNYDEVIVQWRSLTRGKGVGSKVLDMPLLETTYGKDPLGTFISDIVLRLMSFCVQLERDNTLQRQAEGIAAAKERGVRFGCEAARLPDGFESVYLRWRAGEISADEAAALCGFSRRTLYKLTEALRRE